ncbi:MAG: type II toxin-antitoxin system HicA family toxin [Slackia sp.]|nr:type II toxin-antitoxin system HicA family toxin [Slackia sp.]
MTKRRDLVRQLERAGFRSMGGTKHERFMKGNVVVSVKRHREIDDITAGRILKAAGIR